MRGSSSLLFSPCDPGGSTAELWARLNLLSVETLRRAGETPALGLCDVMGALALATTRYLR
jgi:hypothetical protein